MDSLTAAFLHETRDNLAALDADLVALEKAPHDAAVLRRVFRVFHMMKSSCGFMRLPHMERLAHEAEDMLAAWRDGTVPPSFEHISDLFDRADRLKAMLTDIETTGTERPEHISMQAASIAPANDTVRVPVAILDENVDLVSELILARNTLRHHLPQTDSRAAYHAWQRMNAMIRNLQHNAMKTRMQPIRTVWQGLPRLVRDIERETSKQIDLTLHGEETVSDRRILEELKDPLLHLVRNAIMHGIEKPKDRPSHKNPRGQIHVRASHQNGMIAIVVEDDGKGLDEAALRKTAESKGLAMPMPWRNILFEPGFSTADHVTELSGRGVGLDIVRTQIQKMGGTVAVESMPGEFCRFTLVLPTTRAVIPALLIESGGAVFILPQDSIVELLSLRRVNVTDSLLWHDITVPFLCLDDVLTPDRTGAAPRHAVILTCDGGVFGLGVAHVVKMDDIVVKPLPSVLKKTPLYTGVAVLDDGMPALILNPHALLSHLPSSPFVSFKEPHHEGSPLPVG